MHARSVRDTNGRLYMLGSLAESGRAIQNQNPDRPARMQLDASAPFVSPTHGSCSILPDLPARSFEASKPCILLTTPLRGTAVASFRGSAGGNHYFYSTSGDKQAVRMIGKKQATRARRIGEAQAQAHRIWGRPSLSYGGLAGGWQKQAPHLSRWHSNPRLSVS